MVCWPTAATCPSFWDTFQLAVYCTLLYFFNIVPSLPNVQLSKDGYFLFLFIAKPPIPWTVPGMYLMINEFFLNEWTKKKSILWVSPLGLADAIWAMCLDADFETSIICGPVPCSANLGNWSVPLDYTLDSWAQHPEDIPFSTQGWQSKTGHTLEDWTSVFQKCKRNLPNPVHRRTLLTLC